VAFQIEIPFQWRPLYSMTIEKCAVPLCLKDKNLSQQGWPSQQTSTKNLIHKLKIF